MSDYTVFSVLKNLTYLSLAESSVSHFVNVPLPALKTLVMNDGQLPAEAMTRRLRDILPALEDLNLAFNNIAYISPDIFANTSHLATVDLRGNNFDCQCKLKPFIEWAEKNRKDVDVDVFLFELYTCETPERFYIETIVYAVDSLDCPDPTPSTTPATPTTAPTPAPSHNNGVHIAVYVLIAIFIVAAILLVIHRRRRAYAHADAAAQGQDEPMMDQGGGGGGGYSGPRCSDCCVPLFKLDMRASANVTGRGRPQRLNTNDDQRDLMSAPVSVVTSPVDTEAPAHL